MNATNKVMIKTIDEDGFLAITCREDELLIDSLTRTLRAHEGVIPGMLSTLIRDLVVRLGEDEMLVDDELYEVALKLQMASNERREKILKEGLD